MGPYIVYLSQVLWRNVEPVLANNGDNGGTHGTENAFERKDEKNVGTHNGENASRGVPPSEIPTGVPFPGRLGRTYPKNQGF